MGKYSPVGPIAILEALEQRGLLGDYVLVLAHDVIPHVERYKQLLHKGNRHVILDNSAVELGKPMTDGLVDIALEIGADAIVLPDVIGSRDGTLEVIEQFLGRITGLHACQLPWMGVPQGSHVDDILSCAEGIRNLLGRNPAYWGVPRWIANEIGTRWFITAMLNKPEFTPQNCTYPNIHLLGMSKNLEDDLRCVRMPRVAGIDSANPIVMGLKGLNFPNDYKHVPRRDVVDHGTHGVEVIFDYWDATEINDQVVNNVVKLRSILNG